MSTVLRTAGLITLASLTFAGVLAEQGGNRLTLSGGVAFTGNNVGGHAGVQFSW